MARPLKPCRVCGAERTSLDVGPGSRLRCWPCRVASVQEQLQKAERAAPRGGVHRDVERQARCVELYRSGKTLQEIGNEYGISRERVRQIIARVGVTHTDGGATVASRKRKNAANAVKAARRDGRCFAVYGCAYAEASAINGGSNLSAPNTPARLYVEQRRNAGIRGIAWQVTFPQWWEVWQASGLWSQRGRSANASVMARKGDTGPYAMWNVYITSMSQNVVDYQAELKRVGVVCADGYRRLPKAAAKFDARHEASHAA